MAVSTVKIIEISGAFNSDVKGAENFFSGDFFLRSFFEISKESPELRNTFLGENYKINFPVKIGRFFFKNRLIFQKTLSNFPAIF